MRTLTISQIRQRLVKDICETCKEFFGTEDEIDLENGHRGYRVGVNALGECGEDVTLNGIAETISVGDETFTIWVRLADRDEASCFGPDDFSVEGLDTILDIVEIVGHRDGAEDI